jgi:hypothetical protein
MVTQASSLLLVYREQNYGEVKFTSCPEYLGFDFLHRSAAHSYIISSAYERNWQFLFCVIRKGYSYRKYVNFTPGPFTHAKKAPGVCWLRGRAGLTSVRILGEEENCLTLSGLESLSLLSPACSLVTTPTTLYRLPHIQESLTSLQFI